MIKKLKFKKIIIIAIIISVYALRFLSLYVNNNSDFKLYGYLLLSFVLILGGTLGILNKTEAFRTPPKGPAFNHKIYYGDDYSLDGIMGRFGNILAIIMGVLGLVITFI